MRLLSCCLIGFILLASSCQFREAATAVPPVSDSLASHGLGKYSGHFRNGLMTVVLNYISGNVASGYDIHKGVRRNLNGQVEQKGSSLVFVLKEPGGNPYDGTFYITLDSATRKITGKWVPADSTKAKSGAVDLVKTIESPEQEEASVTNSDWDGDLGDVFFGAEGTCKLQYYPSKDSSAQLVTISGNYLQKADTVFIEWQNNSRTPTLHMRLVQKVPPATDSTSSGLPFLEGRGVKFFLNPGE